MTLHRRFACLVPAVLAALALSGPARAEDKRLPVVDHKLYPAYLNPEITVFGNLSLAERYTSHVGPRVSAVWHLLDFVALELHTGYMIGSESSIMRTLRDKSLANRRDPKKPESEWREPGLPGLQQLTYHMGADLQISPLYGKLSFVGEQEGSFSFYGLGGLGVAGTRTITDETKTDCRVNGAPGGAFTGCSRLMAGPMKLVDLPGISPGGNDIFGPGEYQLLPLAVPVEYGLGLRLQGVPPPPPYLPAIPLEVGRWFAFKAEIRQYNWLGINNKMNLDVPEDADDQKGCEQGYRVSNGFIDPIYSAVTSGGRPCYLNIHTVTLAQLGISFVIPVNSFF